MDSLIAGILAKISEMTVFLNPSENSYLRFGQEKAPAYISWSAQNRSQLVRVPAAAGEYRRVELRSPDPLANSYLAFTLMIYAGLYGIRRRLVPPPAADINFYRAEEQTLKRFRRLPATLEEAQKKAAASDFIRAHLPSSIIELYCRP